MSLADVYVLYLACVGYGAMIGLFLALINWAIRW